MGALPCRVTAELNEYERQQSLPPERSEAELERQTIAKMAFLIKPRIASMACGSFLVGEALAESLDIDRPLAQLMYDALEGADMVDPDNADLAEMGRIVFEALAKYARRAAEKLA